MSHGSEGQPRSMSLLCAVVGCGARVEVASESLCCRGAWAFCACHACAVLEMGACVPTGSGWAVGPSSLVCGVGNPLDGQRKEVDQVSEHR